MEAKFKPRIDDYGLEFAAFTAELIAVKLGEMCTIGNGEITPAHINETCEEITILASSIPVDLVATEIKNLRQIKDGLGQASQDMIRNTTRLGRELSELLPFAATDITEQSQNIVSELSETTQQELDPQEMIRLETLNGIQAVFDAPIESDAVINGLLDSIENDETATVIFTEKRPLSQVELDRQLTEVKPVDRLVEYCQAYEGYPVELTALGLSIYKNDSRNQHNKKVSMYNIVNPKKSDGKLFARMLAIRGLVLQHGTIIYPQDIPGKEPKKRRVARSIRIAEYDQSTHDGLASDGVNQYEWASIDEELLIRTGD